MICGNEINQESKVEPICSLKPINSILKIKYGFQSILVIGYGNEVRVYSEDLKILYDYTTYHDSHNAYGINIGGKDNLISVTGLSKVGWYALSDSQKGNGIETRKYIKIVKVREISKNDLFLDSINVEAGKWVIGTSKGIISLCTFGKDSNGSLNNMSDYKIEKCPTIYCMKLIESEKLSNTITIFAGSAFSTINIWDLEIESGKISEKQILKGHKGVVYDISISPNGDTVVSSSDDRKILVWSSDSDACGNSLFYLKYSLMGHKATIWSIDCYWSKRLIASLSEDGCLYIWDLNNKELLNRAVFYPKEKIDNAHQGRGGRVVKFIDCDASNFVFASGGEGGDLKIWRYSIFCNNEDERFERSKVDNLNTKTNLKVSMSSLTPINHTRTNMNDNWYQGVYLIDLLRSICVTRGGSIEYIEKKRGDDGKHISYWKTDRMHQFNDSVYSISFCDNLVFSLGSSKGKVINGQFDLENKKLLWENQISHQNWRENVTFVSISEIVIDELYLTLCSCSKGIVGASISKLIKCENWSNNGGSKCTSEVVSIVGTPKYGEIKCIDIISCNINDSNMFQNKIYKGKIICGTVSGNIFILEYSASIGNNDAVLNEFNLRLYGSLVMSHKGNVSSLMWVSHDIYSSRFISTGQDGKVNSYSLGDKLEFRWSHKWKNKCEYIVKCLKIEKTDDWILIGAVKHDLYFYFAKDSITSTPILVFQHKFGGVKRSFKINNRVIDTKNVIEITWCNKPSIEVIQIDIAELIYNANNMKNNALVQTVSTLYSLYSNPPSRLMYSVSWICNSKFIIGGEDHILRIYDILDDNSMNLIYSIRLLDPIRKINVLKISDTLYLVSVSGGRRMFHIFELSLIQNNDLEMRLLFSNNSDSKPEFNSRFISLETILLSKDECNKTGCSHFDHISSKDYFIVFIGSSKGELVTFCFELFVKNDSKINLSLKEKTIKMLQFVPFSMTIENKSQMQKTLFVGLSNGCIHAYEYCILSGFESRSNTSIGVVFKYEVRAHTSGVNSLLLIHSKLNNGENIVVSAGHDQKISIFSTKFGNLLYSAENAHFSSVRDLCFDRKRSLIFSVSWDQKLNVYYISEGDLISLSKIYTIPIPIWDSSCISFSEDQNSNLIIAGGSGSTQLFRISDGNIS